MGRRVRERRIQQYCPPPGRPAAPVLKHRGPAAAAGAAGGDGQTRGRTMMGHERTGHGGSRGGGPYRGGQPTHTMMCSSRWGGGAAAAGTQQTDCGMATKGASTTRADGLSTQRAPGGHESRAGPAALELDAKGGGGGIRRRPAAACCAAEASRLPEAEPLL